MIEVSPQEAAIIAVHLIERGKFPQGCWLTDTKTISRAGLKRSEGKRALRLLEKRGWVKVTPLPKLVGVRKRSKVEVHLKRVRQAMEAHSNG